MNDVLCSVQRSPASFSGSITLRRTIDSSSQDFQSRMTFKIGSCAGAIETSTRKSLLMTKRVVFGTSSSSVLLDLRAAALFKATTSMAHDETTSLQVLTFVLDSCNKCMIDCTNVPPLASPQSSRFSFLQAVTNLLRFAYERRAKAELRKRWRDQERICFGVCSSPPTPRTTEIESAKRASAVHVDRMLYASKYPFLGTWPDSCRGQNRTMR